MLGKQIRSFKENDLIFREGEAGDCAFLIESGRVLVFVTKDRQEVPLKVLSKGDIFGEMSMIDNSLRSASCRALTDVRLVTVNQEQLLDRVQSADPVVRLLMRALMERLRLQNDAIRGVTIAPDPTRQARDELERNEALERIGLENEIALALQNNEFLPFFQPIYDLETQAIVGCEALIRWIKPTGQTISPGVFIDVLEETPLILDVGKMMIEKCARALKTMQGSLTLPEDFFISVNVSGKQFAAPDFVKHLRETCQSAGIEPRNLKLEVTERIMTEGQEAIETLEACRGLGFRIAIDDFGTGFSSMQYLASMPLHDLKVDRSFISQMMSHGKSLSIVKTLIYMANMLQLNLIAEGIETHAQLALLKRLGVKMGQGFFFSAAVPYDQLLKLMSPATESDKKAA